MPPPPPRTSRHAPAGLAKALRPGPAGPTRGAGRRRDETPIGRGCLIVTQRRPSGRRLTGCRGATTSPAGHGTDNTKPRSQRPPCGTAVKMKIKLLCLRLGNWKNRFPSTTPVSSSAETRAGAKSWCANRSAVGLALGLQHPRPPVAFVNHATSTDFSK